MKVKLNLFQTLLLFLPFLSGCVMLEINHNGMAETANFLLILTLCLIINYQTYLVLTFNKASGKQSLLFSANTYIPAVFFTCYTLYIFYFTIARTIAPHSGFVAGPLKMADFNLKSWIVLFFIVHGCITYYIINNVFVLYIIKKVSPEKQEELKTGFYKPLIRLTWLTVGILVSTMIVSTIITIARS